MPRIAPITIISTILMFSTAFSADAAKSKQPSAGDDANAKRETCCAQFGGRWDPSVNPGYCRGLRGTNMALNFNNCANQN